MEFKIKHRTRLFRYGVTVPWIFFLLAFLAYIFFGLSIKDTYAFMVLIGLFILCAVTEIVFIVLYVLDRIYGGKIVIESDHVDIRLLFRHKKLLFDDISDAKYSHYYDEREEKRSLLSMALDSHHYYRPEMYVRSQLYFYLVSGKVLTLNDVALGYRKKRERWITNPGVDPDEDVKLYQAYQCYCSASRRYFYP